MLHKFVLTSHYLRNILCSGVLKSFWHDLLSKKPPSNQTSEYFLFCFVLVGVVEVVNRFLVQWRSLYSQKEHVDKKQLIWHVNIGVMAAKESSRNCIFSSMDGVDKPSKMNLSISSLVPVIKLGFYLFFLKLCK